MADHPSTGDRRLRQAIESLTSAAQERAARHPFGHLIRGRPAQLELTLTVPLLPRNDDLGDAAARLDEALRGELDALLAQRAVFRPGHVLCLRCAATDCAHSSPPDGRHVFAGYGPSGLPRFQDFAQMLLERAHPRIDDLYQHPPRLVTAVLSGRELASALLPAFRDQQTDYHVHGQVIAGWYPVPQDDGTTSLLALTFQVLSSAAPSRRGPPRRRLGLNVLGVGADGDALEKLYRKLGRIPWQGAVQWGQSVLDSIEKSQGRKNATPEVLSHRVEGLLTGFARRLEQDRRSRERRTHHAESRHSQGDRPTRMAHADLVHAADADVLVDTRRNTLVVLGERGRAHVFNPEGRLVTSVRYTPESIEKKKRLEIWRPASPEEVITLRKHAGLGEKP